MLRKLLVAAIALPALAHADPARPKHPQVLTPPPLGLQGAGPTYAVLPPAPLTAVERGWGLRASIRGRSMDLDSPSLSWADDQSMGPKDIEAGYAWRRGAASAVIGYGQYDLGPRDSAEDQRASAFRHPGGAPGVLGVSFSLHSR